MNDIFPPAKKQKCRAGGEEREEVADEEQNENVVVITTTTTTTTAAVSSSVKCKIGATEEYKKIKKLGFGSHGRIYLVSNSCGKLFILKEQVMRSTKDNLHEEDEDWNEDDDDDENIVEQNESAKYSMEIECDILAYLKRKNCTRYINHLEYVDQQSTTTKIAMYSTYYEDYICMFDFIVQPTTADVMDGDGQSFLTIYEVVRNLIDGLVAMHEQKVVHLDLKPDNILVHPKVGEIKYIDFGNAWCNDSSCFTPPRKCIDTVTFVGTQQYSSPEILSNYESEVDKVLKFLVECRKSNEKKTTIVVQPSSSLSTLSALSSPAADTSTTTTTTSSLSSSSLSTLSPSGTANVEDENERKVLDIMFEKGKLIDIWALGQTIFALLTKCPMVRLNAFQSLLTRKYSLAFQKENKNWCMQMWKREYKYLLKNYPDGKLPIRELLATFPFLSKFKILYPKQYDALTDSLVEMLCLIPEKRQLKVLSQE